MSGGGAQRQGPWKHILSVSGSVVTTPDTLHLEAELKGQPAGGDGKCVADATGIFTDSGKKGVQLLQEARLGTNDVEELCTRGTLFCFTLAPTCFRVVFHDAQQQARKLGELRARPLLVAGNPGFGVVRWSRSAPPLFAPQAHGPLITWLLSLCQKKSKRNNAS